MTSVSSRSTPVPSPASSPRAESAATSSAMEESSSSAMESFVKKFKLKQDMRKERDTEKQRYRLELRETMKDAAFEPETFGDKACIEKISDSLLRHIIVSIALFNGDVLVYACSGTGVRHKHGNIQDHHRIFVTSARLAQKFNDNRTRDDNLRIEVRASDDRTLHGFLGLYDEKKGIAIVTSFSLNSVYTVDTSNHVDLPGDALNNNLFAFGRAIDGTLMGANCSHPVFKNKSLARVNCEITESGHGGPVLYFAPGGSGDIAGLIVKSGKGKITLLPTKTLHNWLRRFLKSKTCHFRGYSLPNYLKTVIPSGFMVQSKILQSLGYPLPPPLLFELNGRLVGRFEEYFGQLHYWEGYPYDFTYDYGPNPIWDQLGEKLTQEISQSVVSVASFKGDVYSYNKRYFACTGLVITGQDCPLILTSASLVRTGDAEGEIDEKLTIKVFHPPKFTAQGTLELYHLNYNIAVVRLSNFLSADVCPQDILTFRKARNSKCAAKGCTVVAIGRATKESHGLLMASMGEMKGKYKAVTQPKNKRSTGVAKKPNCEDLLLSTCQIKKVGIGGPLIGLDGRFIGMNFYDESATTPFLPRKEILTVLCEWLDLKRSTLVSRPVNMDLYSKTRKRKRNEWPVSKPYWFLGGQVNPIDQLAGKVPM